MRLGSLRALAVLGWVGCVKCVLLSLVSRGPVQLSKHLLDRPNGDNSNTRVNVVGRKLLQVSCLAGNVKSGMQTYSGTSVSLSNQADKGWVGSGFTVGTFLPTTRVGFDANLAAVGLGGTWYASGYVVFTDSWSTSTTLPAAVGLPTVVFMNGGPACGRKNTLSYMQTIANVVPGTTYTVTVKTLLRCDNGAGGGCVESDTGGSLFKMLWSQDGQTWTEIYYISMPNFIVVSFTSSAFTPMTGSIYLRIVGDSSNMNLISTCPITGLGAEQMAHIMFNSIILTPSSQTLVSLLKTCGAGKNTMCSISASSTHLDDGGGTVHYYASNAVDGNTSGSLGTYWAASGKVNGFDWLRLDFESTKQIASISVTAVTGYGTNLRKFRVYVGDDATFPGANLMVYISPNSDIGSNETAKFTAFGRYLYVAVTVANTGSNGMTIAELDVLGPPSSQPLCTLCTSGSYCPEGSTTQAPCQAGSYCATPSTQVTCPVNSYCPTSSTVPIACPTYFYSPAGSSTLAQCILSCPANNYCILDVVYACPTNSVSAALSTSQSQCTCQNAQQSIINNKCSCPSGKFPSGGNCVTCPPGMVCAVTFDAATCSQGSYCPSGSISEIPCLAGSYCATPSTQVQCPINTYCPASTVTPIACALNFISPAGSTLSSQCEAAVITVNFEVDGASVDINQTQFKRALPDNVALNSYEDVLVLTQGACPQGYYCPVDTTTAIPCPASTYNNNTHAVSVADCNTCLVGHYCPSASILPTSCAAGSYRIVEGAAQQSDCTVCPSGNYCPIQSVTPTNCSAGTYGPNTASTSNAACLSCPAGEFCPTATTSPIACAAGSYRGTTGGTQQSDCDVCPLGQFCPQLSITPTDCAAGSYRGSTGATNQADCAICITGNYCPIKSVDPTNCSISTYGPVTGGTSPDSCLVCPTGQYCPIATTTPVSCAAGSYRGSTGAGAQADCTVCPSGNYCPIKSIDPVNCTAGTYNPLTAQTSAAACLACTPGDYCPVATTTPSVCPANTFTAGTGSAVCASCPVYSTSPIASTNCTCDAGHYHVVAIGSAAGNTYSVSGGDTYLTNLYPKWTSLGAGLLSYPTINGGMNVVVVKGSTVNFKPLQYAGSGFDLNIYSVNDFYDVRGENLQYKLVEGRSSTDKSYVDQVYFVPSYYQLTNGIDMTYKIGVSGGSGTMLTFDTTNVPSGLYFLIASVGQITKRYAIDLFVSSPTPVTLTYSMSNSLISPVAVCMGDTLVMNSPGAYIYVGCFPLSNPVAASIVEKGFDMGTVTWLVDVDLTMECFVSIAGSSVSSRIKIYARNVATTTDVSVLSGTLTCANCTSGYKADPGAQVCTECGLGYYSNPVSQTCTACPAGTKCPTTTSPAPVNCGVGNYQSQSTQSLCLPCPVGQYCDLAITVTPIDCPAGSYRSTEGAASLADCQTCTTGNYCPIKSVNPTNCAAGSYRSTTGAESQAQCDVCTTGNFCPIQSINPTNCAAGSYRSTTGAESQAQCDTCTTGHYCPIQSINPTDCLAGTYNPTTGGTQVQNCLACPAGEFCPTATTTPTACAAGSYRGEPGATSQTGCTACPSGNYCPIQSVNPTNCSAGSYNPSTGSISISACLSCPLGDYCHLATTTPSFCSAGSYRGSVGATDQAECTVCPSGNFCPIQSIDPTNCSSGTFRPTTAGASVADCLVCATGKYSMAIASSTDCPLCPINYYCTNSITIKTCPTHTSSVLGSSSLLNCRCDQGWKCAYSKRITAVVTLNSTTSSFNSDVGGIKTAFINAVATAAGVSSNQVTINSVIAKGSGGRRLLSLEEGFIDVFTSVEGAERLHKLDLHLSRHSLTLHQGHSWQEAHSVISTSIMRGATLSTR